MICKYTGSSVISAVLFFLLFSFPISASSLKVKNGTIYKGEIVSENSNFIVMKIGETNVSILKSMVVEKDGVRYEHASAAPQTQVDQKETSPVEKELTIKLRNGKVFSGTRISETEKLIVLKSDGTQINIFKNIISEIDSGTGSAVNLPDLKTVEINQENDKRTESIPVQQSKNQTRSQPPKVQPPQVQPPQVLSSLPE